MLIEIRKLSLSAFVVLLIATAALSSELDVKLQGVDCERPAVPTVAPTPEKAPFTGYKGVSIGAKTDEVRAILGDPKDKSDAMDMYIPSDHESVLFYYDAAHLVTAIMITYTGDLTKAPTAKDVFGEDVEPKPDGGVFKMVRYPKASYWISYNRTAGDDAIVSIAMQKI